MGLSSHEEEDLTLVSLTCISNSHEEGCWLSPGTESGESLAVTARTMLQKQTSFTMTAAITSRHHVRPATGVAADTWIGGLCTRDPPALAHLSWSGPHEIVEGRLEL